MRERRVAFYAVMAVKAGEKYELGGMMVSQVRQEGECVEKKTELLRRRTGRERTRLSSAESECNDFHLHLLSALFSCVTFPYLGIRLVLLTICRRECEIPLAACPTTKTSAVGGFISQM